MTIYNSILTKSKLSICLIFAIFFLRLVNCHGHGHSHDGDETPPSFKYSREANEDLHSHSHVHEHVHDHDNEPKEQTVHAHHSEKLSWASQEPRGNSKFRQWPPRSSSSRLGFGLVLQALGATLFVSFVPFLVLFIVPVDGSAEHRNLLKILLSFASGGLLGDAFLHLIPHAYMSVSSATGESTSKFRHGHSHNNGHEEHDLGVGLWVLVGFGVFLLVEKCLRFAQTNHTHSHSHFHNTDSIKKKPEVKFIDPPSILHNPKSASDEDCLDASGDSPRKKHKSDDDSKTRSHTKDIKIAGYLNLVADFIHNFTDGMAIGASFLAGRGIGVITTVTVIFHEIPHEIGDFAILLQSGLSRRNAILLQLVTAIGALTGTVCSLLAEGMGETATAWTLAFTAGGFIYIATVSVIPDLLKDTNVGQSIQEMLAMVVGVVMMILIAKFE